MQYVKAKKQIAIAKLNQLRHARLSFGLHMRVKLWVGMNLLHVSQ